jgi:hypothetical protein
VKFATIYCKDLYDNAAERLKGLDNDIDKTIQELAKNVEARGVPKNKVARQVVKELTAREVLSPSRIYEGLGIEQKRRYKKREKEETFPHVENISTEKSSTSQQAIQVAARTGQSGTLKDMNRGLDIKLVSEEQKQIGALRLEIESLREKEREHIIEIAYLRKENARLNSKNEELERQSTKKTEQESELKKENDELKKENEVLKEKTRPEMLKEIQERFYDEPGLIKGDELQAVHEQAGKNLVFHLERCNSVLQDAVDAGLPVPVGLYIIAKPEMVFVPVRFTVDFNDKKLNISLWEKKLQIPSPSVSVSSDTSKHF